MKEFIQTIKEYLQITIDYLSELTGAWEFGWEAVAVIVALTLVIFGERRIRSLIWFIPETFLYTVFITVAVISLSAWKVVTSAMRGIIHIFTLVVNFVSTRDSRNTEDESVKNKAILLVLIVLAIIVFMILLNKIWQLVFH